MQKICIDVRDAKFSFSFPQELEGTIERLQEQLADYEQELYERDIELAQLESELEVCEKTFLKVNLR